jgi:tRNA pseudouridine13 synthase
MSTEPALSAEESVGIACYVTNSRSISGILKQRFSDFVVREVTKHHPVPVRLESIDGKDLEAQYFPRHKAAVDATEEDVDRFIEQLEAIKDSVTLVLSQSEEVGLREFLMQCVDKDEEAQDSFVAFQCQSKESRTQVHKLIKLHLPQIVEADTVAVNEKQHIRLLAKHKRGAKQGGDVRRSIWPQGLGNYLQFTLLKENVVRP